jgi:hypothetical protein
MLTPTLVFGTLTYLLRVVIKHCHSAHPIFYQVAQPSLHKQYNTNNTITFTEASKSTGTPSSLFRNNSTDEVLTLEVKDANGNYADQLSFYLNNNIKDYTANNNVL